MVWGVPFCGQDKRMAETISFKSDISDLEARLKSSQKELVELREQFQVHDTQTEETRQALEKLRAASEGRLPEKGRARSINAVAVKDSGRPPRGARREQIEQICRRLGRGGEEFRTAAVLELLGKVEDGLTDGMRSYTYAVMNTLRDEGLVKKVGRGRWTLQS